MADLGRRVIDRFRTLPPLLRVVAAVLVVVLVFVSVAKVRTDSNAPIEQSFAADANGSINSVVGAVKIAAPDGTFKAEQKLNVAVLTGQSIPVPRTVALGDLRSVAVKLETTSQPSRPVAVTIPFTAVQPDEPLFGLLWDEQGRMELLTAKVSEGSATLDVEHFSFVALIPLGVMAAIALNHFVGALIDSTRQGTCAEQIPGRPLRQVSGSGKGLVGLTLLPVPADRFRVSVRLCNQLKVWQQYDVVGASAGSGWLLPFSTIDDDIVLGANQQGSPVTIRSRFTPTSAALTLAEMFVDSLPGAFGLYKEVGGAAKGLAELAFGLTCVWDASTRYSLWSLASCFNSEFVAGAIKFAIVLAQRTGNAVLAAALNTYAKFVGLFVSIAGPLVRGLPGLFFAMEQSDAVYTFRVDIAGLQPPTPSPATRTPAPSIAAPTPSSAPVTAVRDSLATTSSPVVGRYFRVPVDVLPGCCVDGSPYGNTVRAGTVVMIKGGPRPGQGGRVWWDLSEVEWGGGTGWFTMQGPAPAVPTTPLPTAVPPPPLPTPPPTPVPSTPAPVPGSGCGETLSNQGTGSPPPLAGPFAVSYAKRFAPGFVAHAPQRAIGYAFNVAGVDLTQLPLAHKIRGLVETPTQWICGWTSIPEYAFVLLMQPEAPTGTYTLTLRLPDGRTATAQFSHQQSR